ncbi:AT-rich interactive domain-containing protein 3 [Raphanus sativus]|nr:AT-rich interactive domain-containing protein 3 [Raphanus sativus]
MESERVEQGTDKEIETEEQTQDTDGETNKGIEVEEQSQDTVVKTNKGVEIEEQTQDTVMETENKNPGETVGEEDPVDEHKDPLSPVITEDVSILAKGSGDDDIPKIDDEKTQDEKHSQLETSPHLSPPSVAIDPEEGLSKTTVEDNVERNIGSSEVSSFDDRDSVMDDKNTPVVHEETATVPCSKLEEEKGSPIHHANTVMDQDKATEEHDMPSSAMDQDKAKEENEMASSAMDQDKATEEIDMASSAMNQDEATEENDMASSGGFDEITVTPDTTTPLENKGSPLLHHADTVMEQEKPAEEVEHNMASSGDHNEVTVTPDTKISDGKGSPHRHANTVMEQENPAEEHNMASSEDHNEITVTTDTRISMVKGSPLHHDADTVMEQDKAEEEQDMISSGDHNEFPVTTDTKDVEENNDRLDKGEADNMNLADHVSEPVDHDEGTTTENEKEPDVPVSETESNLENKPSEPPIETSVNVEKEPDMPSIENLTENDQNSDVLAAGVSGDSDKSLSLLPATQTSSDHNEVVATLEAEHMEDMEVDVPDSILVTDASIDPPNNNDVSVEAPTNAENKDYSMVLVPEGSDADNETAPVRREPGPPCVASSDTKSEVGVSGGLNNGVHKIGPPSTGLDRPPMSPKRSFLLDGASEGYESGTEEDQSAFMKELSHFFRERNMDFKPPKFYGETLNCLKLWRAVIRLGGYDKVTGFKLWRQVGESFRPPKTCTTVSWTFRGFYEKALLEYERHKVLVGEVQIPLAIEPEPMNIDNQASGSGRARRDAAARAMQGWHSQRLNGNGEVNDDPAFKDKNLVLHQKREKQIGTSPGLLKRKRLSSTEHVAKHAIQVSNHPMLDVTVVDVGPPADWVKINVQRTQDCFEVYALVPGLVREEVRVQSDPAGRLVISGEPENPMNPWGATPFKKVVSLPTRIDPHHTSAVVTLNGQLFVRVPLEQSD